MAAKEPELREFVKRIEGTGEFIHVNQRLCNGCGRCAKICPMNVWGLRRGKAVMSPDYASKCVECGSCWMVCQADAIDFRYPDGGTGVVWEYG